MYLNISQQQLAHKNGLATAKEITQQPDAWQRTLQGLMPLQASINDFMNTFFSYPNGRIVLTGAGSSAFAGRALAPYLSGKLKRRIDAIATTDIVADPEEYFAENCPTLLISFARSGNSPESVAAVELASQVLDTCYHLVITCNEQGNLYLRASEDVRSFALLMPPETNDLGFAMTSSLTSMMAACLHALLPQQFNEERFNAIEQACRAILTGQLASITALARLDANKIIYLGSGSLQGVAQEAALKLLELTAGKLSVTFDSPVGFRHGPKSVVDDASIIFIFISNDPYTRQYDRDLLRELRAENKALKVVALTTEVDAMIAEGDYFQIPHFADADDAALAFPFLLFAQIYAFTRSFDLEIGPDNPCPSGEVNRVVQGVNIYPFNR
ncbi:SIS domain-containing protein [Vibrio sp. V27_P1S3P104]|uniref:SIS domain-containing protein n=1 Tax=Vibrio TaxID=662 RepID=UPI000C16F505|nr:MULTISPECIES: SIS domain-containing protein [Vibrio]NAW70574.1 SIS domain-containing protein [Vibrio sp. V28_P6S34P95]NAX06261.1 SIS domain-containing protein [Vibrio sp. V30_P3S12P165]NAX35309.1 SIS domain-containing protein [Vibrio sp. V29_P1S30P107]NAX37878.1 SIS domain-containing protein [Vibrio sp. V27_P1S3P104]NAX40782.1 SIS domain-containing protein [Vibrio sp. V26_P1S5P106]